MPVVDKVLERISDLQLGVGDRLPSERNLAVRCNISRSSARSALKELQSLRVLDVKQGCGYFLASDFVLKQALSGQVAAWSLRRIQQVCEARLLVAPHVTGLAAQGMSEASLRALENCLIDLGKAVISVDIQAMELLHNRFLNIIFESCSNIEYIRMLNEVKIPAHLTVSVMQMAEGEERDSYFSEHVNLFQAVKKKKHEEAKNICVQICTRLALLFEKYADSIFE